MARTGKRWAKCAKTYAQANGNAHGQFVTSMPVYQQNGGNHPYEGVNAHMAERFSRGRHQANDTSGPPKPRPPPSSVLDKEVQRYFDGPLHQKELSHWQQLSEIPTARELLRPQYVLIDDSHLQEPSDAQNGWEADNTWVEGDGSQCDQSATNWEAPNWDDVRMRQTAKNTDFAQATDSNWDAPAPISEWDAPAPLVDGELASGIDPKASASASPINESNDVDDAPQSSDTETPAHKPEASEPGEEMGTSNSQDDSNNQQPSEDAPAEESSAEQATQVTPADTTADGEDSTSSTTVGDAMVNPRDDDDNADLDSQEPPRLQAFNSLGPWASKKKYLRTHYMLLREEALRHLKEAIQILRINSTMTERDGDRSIGIYDGVRIRGLTFARRGLGVKISFDLSRVGKRVKWDQSNRLIPGSLVVLVPNEDNEYKVDELVVATVAARPDSEAEQGRIDLFFARPEDIEIDTNKRWLMLEERAGFFEAQRYTLQALQRMVHESTPFIEQLVEGNKDVEPPTYLLEDPSLKLINIAGYKYGEGAQSVKTDVLNKWPAQISRTLDSSQQRALRRILTKQLALCQGPPGTGKTYVSVQALQVMLDSFKAGDPPIIIACHTNHALDQLLREVANIDSACFVRIGGRSQDKDVIKKQTLYELRIDPNRPLPNSGMVKEAYGALDRLERAMAAELEPLAAETTKALNLARLVNEGILTEAQKASLEANDAEWTGGSNDNDATDILKKWAGNNIVPPQSEDDAVPLFAYEEVELDQEELQEMEAEAKAATGDAEDVADILKGNYVELGTMFTSAKSNPPLFVRQENGKTKKYERISRLMGQTDDLRNVKAAARGVVYDHIINSLKDNARSEIQRLAVEYAQAVKRRTIGQWTENAYLLKQHKIVGMTTTGLSKYRGLIAGIKPRIVLIEEAGEVLEAPVIAGALESVQHLILVGDHRQLKPHLHVHELEGAPYHLDRSLLERLVEAGVEYDQLQTQRRMVPEVSKLLGPIYGEGTIKDHRTMSDPDVRQPVPGMDKRLWFFNHQWPESRDDQRSSLNKEEAAMIVGFVTHLYRNGLALEHITILTFYNGQRRELAFQLRRAPVSAIRESWKAIKIVTVDSYQGEENEVVILSLVRNNDKNSIGFLDSVNRACVALSRAKRGFYMFGNSDLLSCQSELWANIMTEVQNQEAFGNEELRLAPCAHYQEGHCITQPSDWSQPSPKMGGCNEKCRQQRYCSHYCKELCHPGIDHRQLNCPERCTDELPCGHRCKLRCSDLQHACEICPKPRTMSVNRPETPAPVSTESMGSGANAVPVSNPRLPIRDAAPSASSATTNGGTRGYRPNSSATRAKPIGAALPPTPCKTPSYSSIANQPRPSASSSRNSDFPALTSPSMLMPQATRTSPQRRTPSTTVDSRLNDTRQGSPDKWTRFANGAVKEHDTETQARAGATEAASGGAKPRETGWDIAAEIAKKARKPGPGTGIGTGSVRTEELEPAKREGVGRKRWRDVCNAGGSGDEELVAQAKDAAPPTDGVADGIGAGPGQPNSKDEELLIDFGDNVEVEKLEENGSHQPHIEEGDLIDLMD